MASRRQGPYRLPGFIAYEANDRVDRLAWMRSAGATSVADGAPAERCRSRLDHRRGRRTRRSIRQGTGSGWRRATIMPRLQRPGGVPS
jgi:hypothetical protein